MFKRSINITRINKNNSENTQDTVLIESPVDLIVNGAALVNIICLPNDLKELAVGFLYSIGIVDKIEDINDINVDELENKIIINLNKTANFESKNLQVNPISRVVDVSCGISSAWRDHIKSALEVNKNLLQSENEFKINQNIIFSSIIKMQEKTTLFKETGGCHGAAMFTLEGKLLSAKEDIGRHNAIDKVIGDMIIKKQNFNDKILTSTGRLTADSVLKAARAKIPILASLSAAIESGIRIAFAYGITLIGFVRDPRMNIYTHPERLIIS